MEDFGVTPAAATFRIERLLPGQIERVWAYVTVPEKRGTWLASGPMNLRVGGSVELNFRHAGLSAEKTPPEKYKKFDGHTLRGRITRCEPPRLLSFTWGDDADASEVTFELTPRQNDVLLVLTHRRLGDRAMMVNVAGGWHVHLGILADRLEGREPRPFWSTHTRLAAEYEKRITAD